MPANRLPAAKRSLIGGLTVALAMGAMAQSAGAANVGGTPASAEADVSVVELDLAGVVLAELPDLPDIPPMPAEDVDSAPVADGRPAALSSDTPARTSAAAPSGPATATAAVTVGAATAAGLAGATSATGTAGVTSATSAAGTVGAATPAAAPGEEPPVQEPDVLTRPMPTAGFSVLGLSWDAAAEGVVVRYRVRVDGQWSPWEAVGASDIGPDTDTADAGAGQREATDAIVALGADGLQVWADAEGGTVKGLKAVLIDPGTAEGDTLLAQDAATSAGAGRIVTAATVEEPSEQAAATPAASYSGPTIITRAQWGANESLRTCHPDLSISTVSAAVHHTASTNNYTRADVPGLLRGFYAFHTRPETAGGRGWCDIGYNFLVDKFGRVFEGRAGSIDKTVVGAHTGGYNGRTFGVSAIGEYGAAAAPDALVEGIAQTIAWKFSQLHIRAGATVKLTSGGSTAKHPAGTVVTFPTIYGHRDAGQTACPGQNLYAKLPSIRTRVAALVNAGVAVSPYGAWEERTTTPDFVMASGWIHDPDTRSPIRLIVELNGKRTEVLANVARRDIAASVSTAGPAHGFSIRMPIKPGRNVLCLWARNTGGGYDTTLGCRYAISTPPTGFFLNDSFTGTANTVFRYGDPGDTVHFGDWNGDGIDTPMVQRGSRFFVRNSNSSGVADHTFTYGNPGDTVLVGDWNGDGIDTLAVRRGSLYYVKDSVSTGVADKVIMYGNPRDTVLVGDWNGDGIDTFAVRRGAQFFVKDSITTGVADYVFLYGNPGDVILVGDWDGNRTDTLAVRRGITFYLRNSTTSGVADIVFNYGNPGDVAFTGDWNGDGRDTIGIYRGKA